MALSGKLTADFATFQEAVTQAEVKLQGFEGGAAKVESALNRMVDTFTGRKVVAEATLMAEAVERLGGASRLSESELARVATTAGAAADKFLAFGQEVPKNLQLLIADLGKTKAQAEAFRAEVDSWGPVTVKASAHVQSLQSSIGQFNNVLAAAGLHVSNELGTLVELGDAAGKTAAQLGVLGTAGLAVGAAIGGWKLGRAVADTLELDKAIADTTATLLGFGNVAQEEAAAKLDALAAASRRVGHDVKDMAEALAIGREAMRDLQIKAAPAEALDQYKKFAAELAVLKSDGVLPALQKQIEDQRVSLADLARIYGISEGALQLFIRRLKEQKDAHDQLKASIAENHHWLEEFLAKQKAIAEETARWLERVRELERGISAVRAGLLGLSEDEQKRTQQGFEAFGKSASADEAARARNAAAQGLSPTGVPLELASNPFVVLSDDMKKLDLEVQALARQTGSLELANRTVEARRQEALDRFVASMNKLGAAADQAAEKVAPSFPGVGPDVNPWSSLNPTPITVKPIVPGTFGLAGAPAVNVNVSGVWDPATVRQLTDAVSEELMRRSGRKF